MSTWTSRTWANRSISRVLAEIDVNNLTDQATRPRQKNGPADPQTRQRQKQGELVRKSRAERFREERGWLL